VERQISHDPRASGCRHREGNPFLYPRRYHSQNRANKNEEIKPSDPGYDVLKRRFAAEVSGERSRTLLSFLYQFEKYIKHDRSGFIELYAESFKKNKSKWDSILYEFPKLGHTTVSIIFGDISGTAIGYTLDSLSTIGLVEQSRLKPPKPKHVMISPKGIAVIETAIEIGSSNLGLLYSATLTQSSVRASR
jgi:hypothetical protein